MPSVVLNEIDLEGSYLLYFLFCQKNTAEREKIIHRLIDAYRDVLSNLRIHAPGYPDAEQLHALTCSGIDAYGFAPGIGFNAARYMDNAGVQLLMRRMLSEDERPLHIGLWGGANTLAQAIWQIDRTNPDVLSSVLRKLRIYGISDQDHASRWLRRHYGDRLFWIVSPTRGSWFGNYSYWKATWPGISSDLAKHGSEDGKRKTLGFHGGDPRLIDNAWIKQNLQDVSSFGRLYPFPPVYCRGGYSFLPVDYSEWTE